MTPRDVFDPRFRIACDLYNAGLARCLRAAQKDGRLDARGTLTCPATARPTSRCRSSTPASPGRPSEFGTLQFCADYSVVGLANQHHTYGLGVPLIGTPAPAAAADPRLLRPPA